MFYTPEYYRNVSLRLSEVLHDIGVSERMVMRRRRTFLLMETVGTIHFRLLGGQQSVYMLGSQSEGTTTTGLGSDSDGLACSNNSIVIQDLAEWSPGKQKLLMIQDDTAPPGYCYLQLIRKDVPLPVTDEHGDHFIKDTHGRILMKNTVINGMLQGHRQREGPSLAMQGAGFIDSDLVAAFPFKSLPQSVRHWLDNEHSRWTNAEMKKYAATSDCFVVPTGSSVSQNRDFQWRISTSLAERCFMFNLNITQIRCYILLKMILKTFINLHGQKHITSYMCKTILLHCIRSKPSHVWMDSNIINCLTYCVSTLYQCILCGRCPHFIIHGNNLMAGKILPENKHQLLQKISNIIHHIAGSLLGIQIDDLGQRLLLKLDIIQEADYNATFSAKNSEISLQNAGNLSYHTACTIDECHTDYLIKSKSQRLETQIHLLIQTVANIVRYHNEGNSVEQTACRLQSHLFCTTLGSLMASYNIQHNNPVSPQALGWLSTGIDSDVSSSRLKFASVFYCTGDMERTEILLKDTEERYNIQVIQPVCKCYDHPTTTTNGFLTLALHYNEEMLRYITAFCVRFLPSEINCIPKELQYELFRSTEEELLHREGESGAWMDLAVVDSIPYLYFLQYKTYGHLRRIQDKKRALLNLVWVTLIDKKLQHRETSWNLLGQCFEQENSPAEAFLCYIKSLQVRQTHNVARFHLCKLLTNQIAIGRGNN